MEQLLCSFSVDLHQDHPLDGSFPLFEVLFGFRQSIMNDTYAHDLLSIIAYVFPNRTTYIERWRTRPVSRFIDYLQSTDAVTSSMAYNMVIKLHLCFADFTIIGEYLTHQVFWKFAVVFLNSRDWPPSVELITGISVRSVNSKMALRLWLQRSTDPVALALIAKHRHWLYAGKQWPLDTFHLLSACHHAIFRTCKFNPQSLVLLAESGFLRQ
jgi:hypothetical protein